MATDPRREFGSKRSERAASDQSGDTDRWSAVAP
jgi:hypothetical protein